MKILIVDDEFDARRTLRKLLSDNYNDLYFIGDASTVDEAITQLKGDAPDLMFLDIQLGNRKSFELFESIDVQCPVIFVTAYDTYALQAFENLAVGYILKPIHRQKLYQVFDQVRKTITSSTPKTQITQPLFDKIILPGNRESKTVNLNNILFARAEGVYCEVVLDAGKPILCSKPLRYIDERLEQHPDFFRSHKSYMVNLKAIESIAGDYSYINMKRDQVVPVARAKRADLKEVLKQQFY